MVRKRLQMSIAGMVTGAVLITVLTLVAGAPVFAALMVSLVGLALGGMVAERVYDRRALKAEQKRKKRPA